jgi:predicted NAD/FAD-binding protein
LIRERVAVIGSGVAGLTAAYLLARRYDVALYEADDRLGGHAHTHDMLTADRGLLAVDSGFIVYNETTYPLLSRLFAELGVATAPTEMSMSVRCAGCGLEYAGARGLRGVFAQPRSMARPAFLRMLAQVGRFHRQARRTLQTGSAETTLGEFLARGGYSDYFTSHFAIPLVSAVWSAPPGQALEYPASYLFAFLANHGMLSVTGSPQWRTVVGGSRNYVERAVKELGAVNLSTPVVSVSRGPDWVDVRDGSDCVLRYSAAVLATHADQALALLAAPTRAEQELLGAFGYSQNDTVLHTDPSLLPSRKAARASWNYLLPSCAAKSERVQVSYDMNRLQQLGTGSPVLVTLNGTDRIPTDRVVARMSYQHPVYTTRSVAAQHRLGELNTGRIAYAGAYHGWGFHEDGCRSGVAAAGALGVRW